MNLTDVDDKTIKGAQQKNISLKEFTNKYKKAFFQDIKTLNIEKADFYPEASNYIKEIVNLIKILLKKGFAYKAEDNSIYFDISKFKNYGKLSHIYLKNLKTKARIKQDEYDKKQVNDFALWKSWDKSDGNVFWETELPKGRPGWHIECSVMSMKYLGKHFDIHTGGIDLIFPHHENEIAQSESANNKKFVNYWLHNEHLLVNNKKMSKSLGNFYTLRDLLKQNYNPKAIRYLLLSTHYRQKLNFTFKALKSAENTIKKINNFIQEPLKGKDNKKTNTLIKKVKQDFEKAMDNDLNISSALAFIFDFIKEIYKIEIITKKIKNTIKDFDTVLGILKKEKLTLTPKITKLIKQREIARKKQDYKKADKIRSQLLEKGILLEDTEKGIKIKYK